MCDTLPGTSRTQSENHTPRPTGQTEAWWGKQKILDHICFPSYFILYRKVTNFRTVLKVSYFWKSTKFKTVWKFLFALRSSIFNVFLILRPSKVRKLVRTNQFQVHSTKMGTGRKFVTLQYFLFLFFFIHAVTNSLQTDLSDSAPGGNKLVVLYLSKGWKPGKAVSGLMLWMNKGVHL